MKTFLIPIENMGKLVARFEKLSRQVARLVKKGYQAAPVTFEVLEVVAVPMPDRAPDLICNRVSITGETPRIAGWTFLATLQHLEGGTILRAVPTDSDEQSSKLVAYRNADAACDHCHTDRRRVDTFVVGSDAGETKQVGRQCLCDFLGGVSPEEVAAYAQILVEAAAAAEDCEREGRSGEGAYAVTVEQYLPFVASLIRTDGWFSRTAVRDMPGKLATANVAWMFGAAPAKSVVRDTPEMLIVPSVEDVSRAKLALVHVSEVLEARADNDLSDYEHNLRVIIRTGYTDFRGAGIVASLLSYYDRLMGKAAEKVVMAASQHVGEISKRQVFESLTVLKVVDIDGEFGTTHLHVFRDATGNILKWFASNERLQTGNQYKVKGTVKKHEEYQGTKQTLLSRCKVLD